MDDEAFYEGVPWWELKKWPGKNVKFGGRPKLAAYLYFNYEVGNTFRMKELRRALGDDAPADDEHLNRRLRQLRDQDWRFDSYKDLAGQDVDAYVLKAKGKRIWLGERNRLDKPSQAVRREVIERDLNRCVVCGVGAGEPYDREPDSKARMTVGHRVAGARLASASPDNLQTECSRCNEPAGDTPPNPERLDEVMSVVSRLGVKDKTALLDWLTAGRRIRNKVDVAYDRIRRLSTTEREAVVQRLREATRRG
ncbi:HNH endonuclease signature motif containing protein [Williamsia sp.]|uniref:HNH endonuclease n=1 Tax=Williamsia sp. TaxID=1872085 RepID=UPI001A1871C5|nr:HNH endonuclease signature motif containing protein [Williamsia sp.]MBJ7287995.1 HNH endonuclease [Williamsia sp.]